MGGGWYINQNLSAVPVPVVAEDVQEGAAKSLLLQQRLSDATAAYIQARDAAHRWRFDYSALYRNAWNNGLLLFMALVMLGVFAKRERGEIKKGRVVRDWD